ncbi:hypothetical protein ABPG75_014077 [Micractinium tetrahymenae]
MAPRSMHDRLAGCAAARLARRHSLNSACTMSLQLLEALRALQEALGQPGPAPVESANTALQKAWRCWSRLNGGKAPLDDTELCGELQALAEALCALNTATMDGGLQAVAAAADRRRLGVGISAAQLCFTVVAGVRLPAAGVFRVTSAGALLFQCGKRLLDLGPQQEPVQWPKFIISQLSAAGALVLLLDPPEHSKPAAAFAGSAGRPAALLPWLQALLTLLNEGSARDEAPGPARGVPQPAAVFTNPDTLADFCSVSGAILNHPAFSKHATALLAQAGAHQELASCLLVVCMRALAAAAAASPEQLLRPGSPSGRLLCALGPALSHPSMQGAALLAGLPSMQPGGAPHLLRALGILRQLPEHCPDGMPAVQFGEAWSHAARILAAASACVCNWASAAEAAGANAADGGSGGGGAGSDRSDSKASGSDGDSIAAELHGAVWQVPGAVQRGAAVVEWLAASGEAGAAQQAACLCRGLGEALRLLPLAFSCKNDSDAVQAWCEAGEAGLRLQPALAQLAEQLQQREEDEDSRPDSEELAAVAALSYDLMHLLLRMMPGKRLRIEPPLPPVWQLLHLLRVALRQHSAACRLLHWLAARPAQQLPGFAGEEGTAELLQALLCGLVNLMHLATTCFCMVGIKEEGSSAEEEAHRKVSAMAAASVQAVAAAAAWPNPGTGAPCWWQLESALQLVQWVAVFDEAFVEAGLLAPLQRTLPGLVEAVPYDREAWESLGSLLEGLAAYKLPHLSALLAQQWAAAAGAGCLAAAAGAA